MSGIVTTTIDHPLDPENATLTHAMVGSPQLLTTYTGTIYLDANGRAEVELPTYYEALGRDLHYQLTAIGVAAPNLYIAQELRNNRFTIAGGKPDMRVSWQVTAIRHDPYVQTLHLEAEASKSTTERGSYLHPEAYGQPATRGREYLRFQRMWGIRSADQA